MTKVSIIIVSWNVKSLLESAIKSIQENTPNSLLYEVIVVDNASGDGTSEMVRSLFKSVKLIANKENRGFAAACNQGIHEASGEYLLFLNPDTHIQSGTLDQLVDFLEKNPDVGIVGPRIEDEKRNVQASVRGFPTPVTSLLIFLKLDRVLKILPAIRRYYCLDFEYSKTQEVDQPMGACLLVRRKVLDAVGMFDERFFLWFEEVDLCKRVRDAGFKNYFFADATLIHHGAKSFSQQSIITRQRNFYTSNALYLRKHFSNSVFTRVLSSVFFGYVAILRFAANLGKTIPKPNPQTFFSAGAFALAFVAVGIVHFLSLLVYSDIIPPEPVYYTIVLSVFFLSLWKPWIGVSVVFTELVIGSKGYLFSLDSWDSRMSIRMGIFIAVLLAWLGVTAWSLFRRVSKREKVAVFSFSQSKFLWWYVSLALIVGYAAFNGLIRGTPLPLVIQDGNAWLFFLIAPAVYDALRSAKEMTYMLSSIVAALLAQTIGVFLSFYVMGHRGFGEVILGGWYYWIRQAGIGEITALPGSTTRVFFQSQIFALAGIFVLLGLLLGYITIKHLKEKEQSRTIFRNLFLQYRYTAILFVLLIASVIISFSRSFWVAAFGGGIIVLLIGWAHRVRFRSLVLLIGTVAVASILSLGFLVSISSIPFPPTSGIFDIKSLEDRVKDLREEEAAKSRWKLLPVLTETIQQNPIAGYGFGKTVSYESADPRITARYAGGVYTTYAFEWGYLDLWIKFGFIGLVVYLGFLFSLVSRSIQNGFASLSKGSWQKGGLLLGVGFALIALLLTHIFTPYLNHPLGIGMIILASILIDMRTTRTSNPATDDSRA